MKPLVIITGLGIGILVGLLPSIDKVRNIYWKMFIVLSVAVASSLTLLPPLAANISSLYFFSQNKTDKPFNLILKTIPDSISFSAEKNEYRIKFITDNESVPTNTIIFSGNMLPDCFNSENNIIIKVNYDKQENVLRYESLVSVDPIIWYPFLPELEQRIKIMNFHVAVAWISVLAFLVSMIYSARYLKTKSHEYDIKASSSAALGMMFTILATVSGMIWAKFNWGSYWNWDPRETSIFILLLIYGAYFSLRSSIENEETRSRLSSVYSILAFVTVPFLIFILPRITSGLHPGSAGEGNAGPVMSQKGGMLDGSLLFAFGLSLMAFTLLYFWMLNIHVRYKKLEYRQSNQ